MFQLGFKRIILQGFNLLLLAFNLIFSYLHFSIKLITQINFLCHKILLKFCFNCLEFLLMFKKDFAVVIFMKLDLVFVLFSDYFNLFIQLLISLNLLIILLIKLDKIFFNQFFLICTIFRCYPMLVYTIFHCHLMLAISLIQFIFQK